MKAGLFALLFAFVRSVLQSLWDGLWEVLFEAIEYAEEQWRSKGMGERKKEFVIEKVFSYIEDSMDLNFLYRKAIEVFLSKAIDGIVSALNDELGDNWVERVEEYKDELAGFIDFIE